MKQQTNNKQQHHTDCNEYAQLTIIAKMTAGKTQNHVGSSPKKKTTRAATIVMTMSVGLGGGTGWGLGALGKEEDGGLVTT